MGDLETERLAVLETRLEALPRIEAKLDTMYAQFPTRAEVDEKFRSRDERIDAIVEDSRSNRTIWPVWVAAAMAALSWITQWIPHK